jgi:hypothetical protein
MAEFVTVVGLVASIAQLVGYTSKIIRRFQEFQRCGQEIPKTFRNLSADLPLLQEALWRIKEAAEAGAFGDRQRTALFSTLDRFQKQIQGLDDIITRTLPSFHDSTPKIFGKSIKSLRREPKVKHLTDNLHNSISALTFYLTAVLVTPRIPPGTSFRTLY